jgi:hypothetical protein
VRIREGKKEKSTGAGEEGRERKREREKRNVSWWSLKSHLGKGGWLKLGKSEPAATALTNSRLVGRAGR